MATTKSHNLSLHTDLMTELQALATSPQGLRPTPLSPKMKILYSSDLYLRARSPEPPKPFKHTESVSTPNLTVSSASDQLKQISRSDKENKRMWAKEVVIYDKDGHLVNSGSNSNVTTKKASTSASAPKPIQTQGPSLTNPADETKIRAAEQHNISVVAKQSSHSNTSKLASSNSYSTDKNLHSGHSSIELKYTTVHNGARQSEDRYRDQTHERSISEMNGSEKPVSEKYMKAIETTTMVTKPSDKQVPSAFNGISPLIENGFNAIPQNNRHSLLNIISSKQYNNTVGRSMSNAENKVNEYRQSNIVQNSPGTVMGQEVSAQGSKGDIYDLYDDGDGTAEGGRGTGRLDRSYTNRGDSGTSETSGRHRKGRQRNRSNAKRGDERPETSQPGKERRTKQRRYSTTSSTGDKQTSSSSSLYDVSDFGITSKFTSSKQSVSKRERRRSREDQEVHVSNSSSSDHDTDETSITSVSELSDDHVLSDSDYYRSHQEDYGDSEENGGTERLKTNTSLKLDKTGRVNANLAMERGTESGGVRFTEAGKYTNWNKRNGLSTNKHTATASTGSYDLSHKHKHKHKSPSSSELDQRLVRELSPPPEVERRYPVAIDRMKKNSSLGGHTPSVKALTQHLERLLSLERDSASQENAFKQKDGEKPNVASSDRTSSVLTTATSNTANQDVFGSVLRQITNRTSSSNRSSIHSHSSQIKLPVVNDYLGNGEAQTDGGPDESQVVFIFGSSSPYLDDSAISAVPRSVAENLSHDKDTTGQFSVHSNVSSASVDSAIKEHIDNVIPEISMRVSRDIVLEESSSAMANLSSSASDSFRRDLAENYRDEVVPPHIQDIQKNYTFDYSQTKSEFTLPTPSTYANDLKTSELTHSILRDQSVTIADASSNSRRSSTRSSNTSKEDSTKRQYEVDQMTENIISKAIDFRQVNGHWNQQDTEELGSNSRVTSQSYSRQDSRTINISYANPPTEFSKQADDAKYPNSSNMDGGRDNEPRSSTADFKHRSLRSVMTENNKSNNYDFDIGVPANSEHSWLNTTDSGVYQSSSNSTAYVSNKSESHGGTALINIHGMDLPSREREQNLHKISLKNESHYNLTSKAGIDNFHELDWSQNAIDGSNEPNTEISFEHGVFERRDVGTLSTGKDLSNVNKSSVHENEPYVETVLTDLADFDFEHESRSVAGHDKQVAVINSTYTHEQNLYSSNKPHENDLVTDEHTGLPVKDFSPPTYLRGKYTSFVNNDHDENTLNTRDIRRENSSEHRSHYKVLPQAFDDDSQQKLEIQLSQQDAQPYQSYKDKYYSHVIPGSHPRLRENTSTDFDNANEAKRSGLLNRNSYEKESFIKEDISDNSSTYGIPLVLFDHGVLFNYVEDVNTKESDTVQEHRYATNTGVLNRQDSSDVPETPSDSIATTGSVGKTYLRDFNKFASSIMTSTAGHILQTPPHLRGMNQEHIHKQNLYAMEDVILSPTPPHSSKHGSRTSSVAYDAHGDDMFHLKSLRQTQTDHSEYNGHVNHIKATHLKTESRVVNGNLERLSDSYIGKKAQKKSANGSISSSQSSKASSKRKGIFTKKSDLKKQKDESQHLIANPPRVIRLNRHGDDVTGVNGMPVSSAQHTKTGRRRGSNSSSSDTSSSSGTSSDTSKPVMKLFNDALVDTKISKSGISKQYQVKPGDTFESERLYMTKNSRTVGDKETGNYLVRQEKTKGDSRSKAHNVHEEKSRFGDSNDVPFQPIENIIRTLERDSKQSSRPPAGDHNWSYHHLSPENSFQLTSGEADVTSREAMRDKLHVETHSEKKRSFVNSEKVLPTHYIPSETTLHSRSSTDGQKVIRVESSSSRSTTSSERHRANEPDIRKIVLSPKSNTRDYQVMRVGADRSRGNQSAKHVTRIESLSSRASSSSEQSPHMHTQSGKASQERETKSHKAGRVHASKHHGNEVKHTSPAKSKTQETPPNVFYIDDKSKHVKQIQGESLKLTTDKKSRKRGKEPTNHHKQHQHDQQSHQQRNHTHHSRQSHHPHHHRGEDNRSSSSSSSDSSNSDSTIGKSHDNTNNSNNVSKVLYDFSSHHHPPLSNVVHLEGASKLTSSLPRNHRSRSPTKHHNRSAGNRSSSTSSSDSTSREHPVTTTAVYAAAPRRAKSEQLILTSDHGPQQTTTYKSEKMFYDHYHVARDNPVYTERDNQTYLSPRSSEKSPHQSSHHLYLKGPESMDTHVNRSTSSVSRSSSGMSPDDKHITTVSFDESFDPQSSDSDTGRRNKPSRITHVNKQYTKTVNESHQSASSHDRSFTKHGRSPDHMIRVSSPPMHGSPRRMPVRDIDSEPEYRGRHRQKHPHKTTVDINRRQVFSDDETAYRSQAIMSIPLTRQPVSMTIPGKQETRYHKEKSKSKYVDMKRSVSLDSLADGYGVRPLMSSADGRYKSDHMLYVNSHESSPGRSGQYVSTITILNRRLNVKDPNGDSGTGTEVTSSSDDDPYRARLAPVKEQPVHTGPSREKPHKRLVTEKPVHPSKAQYKKAQRPQSPIDEVDSNHNLKPSYKVVKTLEPKRQMRLVTEKPVHASKAPDRKAQRPQSPIDDVDYNLILNQSYEVVNSREPKRVHQIPVTSESTAPPVRRTLNMSYEQDHERHAESTEKTEPMKVVRGNILIKNSMDISLTEDEDDDNLNIFDDSFSLNKQNPLYSSDQDLYKSFEQEERRPEFTSRFAHESAFSRPSGDSRYWGFNSNNVDIPTGGPYREMKTETKRTTTRSSSPNKKKQNLSQLLLSRLANIDAKDVTQHIDVEHHHEEIYGDINFIHADGSKSNARDTTNFDTVSEHIDLMLKKGTAIIIIRVIAERITPVDMEFHVWRKSQAIVTRRIEIDLRATDQRKRLYDNVMRNTPGKTSGDGDEEAVLSSKDTLKLFSRLLTVAAKEDDAVKKDDMKYESSHKKTYTKPTMLEGEMMY